MFTGIIEATGIIKTVEKNGTNKSFWIECSLVNELKIDQSVSHDGVCLTIEEINEKSYKVTAIDETLKKTNLDFWQPETLVNIERCMILHARLDGHIVQGHVDTTAKCIAVKALSGSHEYIFEYPEKYAALLIEKGSVTVNGTSLTCFNLKENTFTVAIIPYTFEHTSIKNVIAGSLVNIEFDMIGKYIQRLNSIFALQRREA